MNPFDYPIGDRQRSLQDGYRTMYDCRKVGYVNTSNAGLMNGTAWVTLPFPLDLMSPTVFDVSMYEIMFVIGGGAWAGTSRYRIMINGQKVYPFGDDFATGGGVFVGFGSLSMNVRVGEVCTVEGRSTNAGDNTGQSLTCSVNMVQWEHIG